MSCLRLVFFSFALVSLTSVLLGEKQAALSKAVFKLGSQVLAQLNRSSENETEIELKLSRTSVLDIYKGNRKIEILFDSPLEVSTVDKLRAIPQVKDVQYFPETNSLVFSLDENAIPSVMQANDTIFLTLRRAGNRKAKITQARFEKGLFKGNVIVLEMDVLDEPMYFIEKVGDRQFNITLENAARDESVQSSLVSSEPSDLIRAARILDKEGDLVVKLFVNTDVNIGAMFEDGRMYISDVSNLPQLGVSRAQPKLDKEEGVINEVKKYTGKLISLDLQDADITNALRIIAEVSNLNIVTTSDVTGKITLRLIDVPWDQALDVILKSQGLDKVQEGNVVRISPVERLRREREALKQAQVAQEELEPLQIKYIRVSYAKAAALKPILETVITDRGSVTFDERTNQIIIKDIKRGIDNVTELVKKLDLRTPQVLLETIILEADRSVSRSLGMKFGFDYIASGLTGNPLPFNFPHSMNLGIGADFPVASGTGSGLVELIFGSADGTKDLRAIISAFEQDGSARIISKPTLVTTNNSKASIEATEVIRIKKNQGGNQVVVGSGGSATGGQGTDEVKVGIKLTMTPQASPDYWILLDLTAESSSFGSKTVDDIPSTIERRATSTVLVSSGQTFVLGGIYKINDRSVVSGLPFLKDIPVLGYAFRSQITSGSDEELIFIVTPRIVEGSFDDAAMTVED